MRHLYPTSSKPPPSAAQRVSPPVEPRRPLQHLVLSLQLAPARPPALKSTPPSQVVTTTRVSVPLSSPQDPDAVPAGPLSTLLMLASSHLAWQAVPPNSPPRLAGHQVRLVQRRLTQHRTRPPRRRLRALRRMVRNLSCFRRYMASCSLPLWRES